ncbi:hypothetical protein OAO18_03000 [Francisellaceae bacterium]|nr:hypothetical protein [Francisellaceae bacterium]
MSAAIPYIHFKPSNNDEENYILSPDTGNKTGYNQFWDGDYLVMNNVIKYDANNVPDTSNSGANTGHPLDQLEPNGFWITNLNNIFVNNSVAGCQFQGRGYWVVNQSATANSFPAQNAYPVFSSNRAHGCFGGLDTDSRMTAGINGSFTNNPKPTAPKIQITAQGTDQPPVAIFNGLDITRMRYKGVWTRTLFSNIADSYFAALKQGVTVLGGGGPEGNIFGFWSMVQDSVFAGITRNNVNRYFDCENYAQTISSFDNEKILTSAYEVNGYNEASECTSLPKMVAVTKNGKTTNEHIFSLAGDQSATNFNLQGYTFYDGPARLENNRFINFRADATDRHTLKSDNLPDNYPLVGANKVDVLKMRDYRNTSQISNKSYAGGTHYYGYDGDAAMSWLKANAQAVPPSQYSLGNLWQNTDFKHQVFTELSNLSNELHDGDKSTIIIDKDGSLSGFRSCDAQGKCNIGTETLAHHFPISLNNLDIYATAYSLDEPDSSGRNNVRPSSLMSPHQYAGINIEGVNFEAGDNGHPKIKIIRDMSVYGKSELPYEKLTGRGGQGIYELFFMNHMGYTIANDDKKTFSTNLLLSYSDAPIEHLFANRISICVGKGLDVDKIKINKTLRQWGTTQNYNTQRSTYLEDDSVVKNQKNCDTLYNSPNKAEQWQACFDNKTLSLTKTNDLKTINKELVDVISDNSQPNAAQSYYYNAENGMLYFNMIQAGNVKPNKITTPYVSCDIEIYESALEAIKQTKDYTDPALVERALSIACLVKDNQPQPEELLACPDEGCATYALNITNAGSPQPSPCDVNNISQAQIVSPILEDGKLPLGLPLFNESTGQINYQSEYYLASMNNLSQLPIKSGSVLVADKPYYYHCSSNVSYPQTGYLPLAEILCTEDNLIDYTGNPGFSATSFGSDTPEPGPGPGPGPTPTNGVKWLLNMGPNVAMSLSIDDGQSVLISNGSDKSTITVESGSEAGKNEIFYVDKDVFSAGVAATLKYGPPGTADKYSCQITMNDKGANQAGGTCNECGLAPLSATSTSITFGANCH